MRILLLNDYQTHGGVEVMVQRTASMLRENGHEVRVLTGDQICSKPSILGYISNARCKRAVRDVITEFAPHVIHVHNLYHLLSPAILSECERARAEFGSHILVSAHDHHLVCPNPGGNYWLRGNRQQANMPVRSGLFGMLRKRWDHRTYAHSILRVLQRHWNYTRHKRHLIPDVILSPSEQLAKYITALGDLDVRVLPNPAPAATNRLRPNGSISERLAAVVVSRLDPEKGVAELIRDWPSDLAAKLSIVGDGKETDRCKKWINRKRAEGSLLEASLLGQLPHDQAMNTIADADLLIVPSIGSEVAPLVVDEAFALGTAVLVTNQPALQSLVESKGPAINTKSWIYSQTDASDLRAQLMKIESARSAGDLHVTDSGLSSHFFTESEFLQQLLSVYQDRGTNEG